MSKQKVIKHSADASTPDQSPNGKFVTARGKVIHLLPVSPYTLDDIGKSVGYPEQPKYEIHTEIVDETHLMDETCLEVPGDPEETLRRQRVWAEYQRARSVTESILTNKLLEVIVSESVILDDDEPSGEWINRRKRIFGNVPDDPIDLKVYYVLRELVRTPSEVEAFITRVLRLSEIDEEKLLQAEASFRRSMEGRVGSNSAGTERDTEVQKQLEA